MSINSLDFHSPDIFLYNPNPRVIRYMQCDQITNCIVSCTSSQYGSLTSHSRFFILCNSFRSFIIFSKKIWDKQRLRISSMPLYWEFSFLSLHLWVKFSSYYIRQRIMGFLISHQAINFVLNRCTVNLYNNEKLGLIRAIFFIKLPCDHISNGNIIGGEPLPKIKHCFTAYLCSERSWILIWKTVHKLWCNPFPSYSVVILASNKLVKTEDVCSFVHEKCFILNIMWWNNFVLRS